MSQQHTRDYVGEKKQERQQVFVEIDDASGKSIINGLKLMILPKQSSITFATRDHEFYWQGKEQQSSDVLGDIDATGQVSIDRYTGAMRYSQRVNRTTIEGVHWLILTEGLLQCKEGQRRF